MDPADRLYTVPLDEFTAARNELAKQLRKDGDRERADEVKALRKPSQAAWALNQAVRAEPGAVGELLHAGRRLRRVQEDVVAGAGDRDELRAAVEAEREAVASLSAEAESALGSPTEQVRNRIRDTLHAAAGDEQVAELLKAGRLTEDHEAVGLGSFGAMAPAAAPKKGPKKAADKAPRKSKAAKAGTGKKDERAAQKERERKTRAREIQKQLTRVERDAEKAARELAAAARDRERAEMAFKSALRAHEEARAKAEAKREEAAKLRAELEGLGL